LFLINYLDLLLVHSDFLFQKLVRLLISAHLKGECEVMYRTSSLGALLARGFGGGV